MTYPIHAGNARPKEPIINHRRASYIATLILLLAALLRLAAFQEALVGADQSAILAAAADIAAGHDFPIVGMKSSVGVMQTPAVAYLAALPLLLLRRVIAIRWAFSALDLLVLAFLYRAVSRTLGRTAGLVAALLLAGNPWLVEFNRWIWYQTLIPTFATLAFAALLLLLGRPKSSPPVLIALAMIAATLMGLVHLASLPWAALLCLPALAIAWRRRAWWAALGGVLGSLAVSAPYISFLMHTRFIDVGTILASGADRPSSWNLSTYRLTWELLSGHQVLQTPRDPLWANSVLRADGLTWLLLALLAAALLTGAWSLVTHRGPRRNALALALGWSVLAPTLFVRSTIHLQHFYLLFVFPAPFVLIGATLDRWLRIRSARRAVGTIALGGLLLLTAWWAHLWIIRIGFEQQGRLRAPTRAWLMDTTADRITGLLARDPDIEVIIMTDFDSSGLSPFDWIRNAVQTDRLRTVPVDEGLIVPAGRTCYLIGPKATEEALAPIAAQLTEDLEMAIPASPPWRFFCGTRPPLTALPPAAWENGLSLIESKLGGTAAPGGRLALVHTWHYRAIRPQEYHFYNHLLLGGALVAQIDGAGVPTRFWRDDDLLITRFTLGIPAELAPGVYRLNVGAYTWPAIERVARTDGSDGYEVASWEW